MVMLTRASLLLALAAVTGTAAAAGPWDSDVNLDLRVGVQRETGEIHYQDGGEAEFTHTRIAATLYETSIRWFQPGLYLATGWSSLDGDAAVDGLDPAGESIGLRLRSEVLLGGGLAWLGDGGYTWHGLDDEAGGTRLELQWYELDLRTGLVWTTERIVLSGGAYYLDIDGEQELSGDANGTRDFGLDQHLGAWAGFDVRFDRTGVVGLYAQTGPRESVGLRFARRF